MKSMTYVLARTVSGATLTFNTKAQSGRNSELYCELIRVQQPFVNIPEIPLLPDAQVILYSYWIINTFFNKSNISISIILLICNFRLLEHYFHFVVLWLVQLVVL